MTSTALSLLLLTAVIALVQSKNAIDFMSEVVRKDTYIMLPPEHQSNKATDVSIGMYVNSMELDDSTNMDLSLYLRQSWQDPRLTFSAADYDGENSLTLPDEAWKSIWIPDIFFRNEKQVTRLHDTGRENVLMRVNSTGHLWFVIKLTAKLSCPMNLQKFPFDTQMCPIMFESFRYTQDIVSFLWLDNPLDIDPSVTLKGFNLDGSMKDDCSMNYTAGAFPCLEIRLQLSRDPANFAIKLFVPSVLLVIISWLSLWMHVDRYPERVGVLLIIILIMCVQYGMLTSGVTQVPYIRCMDIWIIVCVLFVFLAMLEATLVKAIGTKHSADAEGGLLHNPTLAYRIDVLCRCVFPVVFLLFIIIFFSVYN